MTVEEKLKFFFRQPNDAPNTELETIFSTLYLLRRDIYTCFGIDPNNMKSEFKSEAIWPGVMGILAGVDLLAKFDQGSDEIGGVGPRFKAFLKTYWGLLPEDAETIYQLRNSLLHSFGLYSEIKRKNHPTIKYRFSLNRTEEILIKSGGEQHVINVKLLHQSFEKSISMYHSKIEGEEDLQYKFLTMFPNYSGVEIGKPKNG